MIIHSDQEPLEISDILDPEAMLYYTFHLKPPTWTSSTEYVDGDIVSPSSPTGYYYKVVSSGVSGVLEPVWSTIKNSKTEDNTVVFRAVNNTAYLSSNGSLYTPTAAFTTTESVPISNQTFTAFGRADVQVGPVPSGVSSFILKLSFETDTGYPTRDFDERSVIINVEDR